MKKKKKKNEEDSGGSSKMTPSCKWPIEITVITEANKDQSPWGIFSTSQSVTHAWLHVLPFSKNTIP